MSKSTKNEKNNWLEKFDQEVNAAFDNVSSTLAADLLVGDKIKKFRGGFFSVEVIEECPSQWRTHVHINRSMCYDGRVKVQLV